jgi:hypothetical protein
MPRDDVRRLGTSFYPRFGFQVQFYDRHGRPIEPDRVGEADVYTGAIILWL